jgi:transposase
MRIERIDDLGLLIGAVRKSGLVEVLDAHYPCHHNWEGPSLGKIVCGWLSYLLSEADHRLSHIEDWAADRLMTLRLMLDEPELEARHFRDQHLEVILDHFSDRDRWSEMLSEHVGGLLAVYPLKSDIVRLDAMITQSYRDIGGLFQLGHSKQHVAGLPQIKEMMAVGEDYGLPLAIEIVSGERADDQLYLPIVERVRASVSKSGLLYVGDSKMGSLQTRQTLTQQGNGYLCPLSLTQFSNAQRVAALQAALARRAMQEVRAEADPDDPAPGELKAYGFSMERTVEATDERGKVMKWQEQLFFVCSVAHQQAQQRHLEERLSRAETKIEGLLVRKQGRKLFQSQEELQAAIDKVVKQCRVEGLLKVEIESQVQTRTIAARGKRPEREETTYTFTLTCQRDQAAIESHSQLIGWQVYATNQPEMSFEQAVTIYRKQYRIEHKFDQLLNRTLNLLPVYLHLEQRICALIRLLMLALQFSAIIEHQVRSALEEQPEIPDLKGLYPGHKGRATRKPTTTMILMAFRNLFVVYNPDQPQAQQVQIQGWQPKHQLLLQLANIDPYYYQLQPITETQNFIPET